MHRQELLPPERYEVRARAKVIYATLEGTPLLPHRLSYRVHVALRHPCSRDG